MLTEDQLADQLRAQLRREIAAIEPRTDLLASLRRRQARRSLAMQAGLVAAPAAAAAAAAAVAMLVSAGGRGAAPGKSTVLTTATVQRMASESRLALAQSGRATISYRLSDNGASQGSGRDSITFAGKNWNDVISQTYPVRNGQRSHTEVAINRIVNGRLYLHVEGKDGRARWYRDTNPTGHPSIKIPDPRALFGLLDPSAKFEVIGHRVVGGVRLTELRATKTPQLRALGWLPGVAPGARVEFLTVWVDRHHVVHQMSLRVKQYSTVDPIYFKKSKNGNLELLVPSKTFLKEARAMAKKVRGHDHATVGIDPGLPATVHHHVQVAAVSVTFSGFGQPQVITAPRHAIPQYTRG
jgi:hypothetical protein